MISVKTNNIIVKTVTCICTLHARQSIPNASFPVECRDHGGGMFRHEVNQQIKHVQQIFIL